MKPCNSFKLRNSGALHHGAKGRIWGTLEPGWVRGLCLSVMFYLHLTGQVSQAPVQMSRQHRIKQAHIVLRRHTLEEATPCDIPENSLIQTYIRRGCSLSAD